MGKSVLIVLLGFIVIFNIIANNMNRTASEAEIAFYDLYGREYATSLAESGAYAALSKISSDPSWQAQKSNIAFGNGTFTFGAVSDTSFAPNGIRIYSYGNFNNIIDTVFVRLTFWFEFPVGVRAGLSTNSEVRTSGGMTIDGRDHDEDGNVIPNSGTLGISTTSVFSPQPNSYIGGTVSGADYEPLKPGDSEYDPVIIEEGAEWPGGFPGTPDSAMGGPDAGYSEGKLKSIAQSGFNGSQYVTHPDSLTFPLSGVTYVEMGIGQTWQGIDFGNSTGTLVVHNSTSSSKMKNLNTGTFKGLIMADHIEHVHTDIIGAVITFTSINLDPLIGNGGGSIKYSSELVRDATSGLPGIPAQIELLDWIY